MPYRGLLYVTGFIWYPISECGKRPFNGRGCAWIATHTWQVMKIQDSVSIPPDGALQVPNNKLSLTEVGKDLEGIAPTVVLVLLQTHKNPARMTSGGSERRVSKTKEYETNLCSMSTQGHPNVSVIPYTRDYQKSEGQENTEDEAVFFLTEFTKEIFSQKNSVRTEGEWLPSC